MSPPQTEHVFNTTESDGLESIGANLLATLSLVVLIVLVSIVVLLRKGNKEHPDLPVEVVEIEVEEDTSTTSSSGGLLARATQKQ